MELLIKPPQLSSETGVVSDLWVKSVAAVAVFCVGCFLGIYLQKNWNKPNFSLEAHVQVDLQLDNLDKSDKDDAKKSSEPKDEKF